MNEYMPSGALKPQTESLYPQTENMYPQTENLYLQTETHKLKSVLCGSIAVQMPSYVILKVPRFSHNHDNHLNSERQQYKTVRRALVGYPKT